MLYQTSQLKPIRLFPSLFLYSSNVLLSLNNGVIMSCVVDQRPFLSHSLSPPPPQLLVDLSSKNDRGLYEARVKAVVGGRPLTFYSLVGLENESFYCSMPRIIALALDDLKT